MIANMSSRGVASWRATFDATLNSAETVTYALRNAADDAALTGAPTIADTSVVPVRHADDDSSADAVAITAVYGDENRFRIAGALYTYDSNDLFISDDGTDDGKVVDLAAFEKLIGANLNAQPSTQANIEIVAYDDDGTSIFRVGTGATP